MKRRTLLGIGFSLIAASVPLLFARDHDADQHGKHGGNYGHDNEDEEGSSGDKHDRNERGGRYFRQADAGYLRRYYSGPTNLPPGLRKKYYRRGTLPPGWAKRF